MTIDDDGQLILLKEAGSVVSLALRMMLRAVEPGVDTAHLDGIGAAILRQRGVRPAPPTRGFPAATCISVNEVAAHGIPSPGTVLRDGDVVNIDVSGELDGYWVDTGRSITVGDADAAATALVAAARAANLAAVNAARAGRPLWHIGAASERVVRRRGFSVLRNVCGHGCGSDLWEPPDVLGHRDPTARTRLREGQVLAIEPFVSERASWAIADEDGWTLRTPGSRSAQFEHTIVVTHGKPIVVTA